MNAYYNEIDPHAAQWLRNLIDAGHIASGVVDERDVRDVRPADLDGFTQCHFFAGVGIWSYASRLAGISDEQSFWTASCPCQPFSAAGAGAGIDDERHLWPVIHWLAEQCRPAAIFGEQVASKDGLNWFDIVSSDMEAADYAIGAIDTCAAGFGAPHIRQRLYFAAHDMRSTTVGLADTSSHGAQIIRHNDGQTVGVSQEKRAEQRADVHQRGGTDGRMAKPTCIRRDQRPGLPEQEPGCGRQQPADGGGPDRLGNANVSGLQGSGELGRSSNTTAGEVGKINRNVHDGGHVRVADADGQHGSPERKQRSGQQRQQPQDGGSGHRHTRPGPVNGPWADADWLFCRDGKWRPVESGTFPLVTGATSRMGRLRAYGNGLCAEQAAGFISAYMEQHMVDLDETPAGDLFEWGV